MIQVRTRKRLGTRVIGDNIELSTPNGDRIIDLQILDYCVDVSHPDESGWVTVYRDAPAVVAGNGSVTPVRDGVNVYYHGLEFYVRWHPGYTHVTIIDGTKEKLATIDAAPDNDPDGDEEGEGE